ncbi:MAG: Xaa-Pro peptidase family protein [Candidatus Omnitrophota bacterium]
MFPAIKRFLKEQGLDGLVISSPYNISYLSGIISRDSLLIISEKANLYLTDSRYTEEAKNKLPVGLFKIEQINGSLSDLIAKLCKKFNFKRLGFEAKYLSFGEYQKLKEKLDKIAELIPVSAVIEDLRQIKTPREIDKIKEACRITIEALKFIRDFILPGKKEIEVAAELERFIRYNGAHASSFDIIVASGPNSSFPHHLTSERVIQNNEPVLIDIGVDYSGYKSDLTRVFFLGKISPLVNKIYGIILEAQARAIQKIKPAVKIGKIDGIARQYITKQGYGGFFGHNLGHGIGLEVHEAPNISSIETSQLRSGMVFTVEPGIYLAGKFGIRIEDMCLVTQKGVEVISGSLNK